MSAKAARRESRANFEAHDPYARSSSGKARFLCPFADCAAHQNPKADRSLCFNEQNGLWHCWRCDARGQDPAFWKSPPLAATGYKSAKERRTETLRRAFAVPAPKSLDVPTMPSAPANPDEWISCLGARCPLEGTPGAHYLESRGLPADYCQAEGVWFSPDYYSDKAKGYWGSPAVMFPLFDEDGHIVAAQGRKINHTTGRKALTTRGGTNGGLFDTQGAFDGPVLVIVEAPIDALSLDLCGLPAIATCGASNFPDRLKHAALNRVVLVAHDADDAGEKAYHKITDALALAAPLAVLRLRPADGFKDWNAQLQATGADALAAFLSGFVSLHVDALLPAPSVSPLRAVPVPTVPRLPEPPAAAVTEVFACAFGDVPPVSDPAALLAFVQFVHAGTGLDIRAVDGRIVIVENGFIVSVWAGPDGGRLAFGGEYWRAVPPISQQLFGIK